MPGARLQTDRDARDTRRNLEPSGRRIAGEPRTFSAAPRRLSDEDLRVMGYMERADTPAPRRH